MLKIVADENITGLARYFGSYGDIATLPGREISTSDLKNADALLVRSVTPVDAALLENTAVRFVGSVTAGVDHIDQDYLAARGTTFAYAPGCNADAVADYVLSAIAALLPAAAVFSQLKVGIVGLGEVGGRVAERLHALQARVFACDPFVAHSNYAQMVPLEALTALDVLSLHVPLTTTGEFPTLHMFDAARLASLADNTVLINTSRGPVLDNAALREQLLQTPGRLRTVLDVWENEPEIDPVLLQAVDIATPHIAGHSGRGKRRGSEMVCAAFERCFGVKATDLAALSGEARLLAQEAFDIRALLLAAYDVRVDDLSFRQQLQKGLQFDAIRKAYTPREEYADCALSGLDTAQRELASALNFSIAGA